MHLNDVMIYLIMPYYYYYLFWVATITLNNLSVEMVNLPKPMCKRYRNTCNSSIYIYYIGFSEQLFAVYSDAGFSLKRHISLSR